MSEQDYKVIDAVVNIWTAEALSHRPGWTDEFFLDKVKGKHSSGGVSLETMLEQMDEAGIERGFLVAAKSGRPGLPGSYHMPPEVVADAVKQYPDRFYGHRIVCGTGLLQQLWAKVDGPGPTGLRRQHR